MWKRSEIWISRSQRDESPSAETPDGPVKHLQLPCVSSPVNDPAAPTSLRTFRGKERGAKGRTGPSHIDLLSYSFVTRFPVL